MSKASDIQEIKNPQEFKEFYLQDPAYSYCTECNQLEYSNGAGFLEIIALTDYLKRVFNVIGIDEIHVITLDGAANNQEEYNKNITIAHQETIELIKSISS